MRTGSPRGSLFRAPSSVTERDDGTDQSGIEPRGVFALLARPALRRAVLIPTTCLMASSMTAPSIGAAVQVWSSEDHYEGVLGQ